jgi:hypothetical protein
MVSVPVEMVVHSILEGVKMTLVFGGAISAPLASKNAAVSVLTVSKVDPVHCI